MEKGKNIRKEGEREIIFAAILSLDTHELKARSCCIKTMASR
jgi:hypothetical protein